MLRDPHEIIRDVKDLAVEYYAATGKPLGVTGEIAESLAANALNLELAGARNPGFDALQHGETGSRRIQIKGRWKRNSLNWGRVPSIATSGEFDSVMLVLLRGDYELFEIWEASREAVLSRLDAPGSKARNERRSLGVSQFKSIANKVWPVGGAC